MGNELLRGRGLAKRFGDVAAVRHVDLDVGAGEFLAVAGRSGSGKSTLLNLLAGLETPDEGQVFFRGQALDGMDEDGFALWRRRHVGLVFQAYHLVATLSALENVALPLYPEPVGSEERLSRARARLAEVGLEPRVDHRPSQLSGGEQQRVAIARALISEPDLVLADEPTGNLDSSTGEEILCLFDKLRRESGIALVVVTHDEQVASSADRIVRMADGQKVFADAPAPKVMLTVFGGDHSRPYGGSLATTENPERLGATLNGPTTIVNSAAIAFLDRYLKDEANALSRVRAALADEVSVKLEVVE